MVKSEVLNGFVDCTKKITNSSKRLDQIELPEVSLGHELTQKY